MTKETSFEKWFKTKADSKIGNSLDLCVHLFELIQEVWDMKQAKIDSLMLEYCPEDMTDTQIEEWAEHQKVYQPGDIYSCLDAKAKA